MPTLVFPASTPSIPDDATGVFDFYASDSYGDVSLDRPRLTCMKGRFSDVWAAVLDLAPKEQYVTVRVVPPHPVPVELGAVSVTAAAARTPTGTFSRAVLT